MVEVGKNIIFLGIVIMIIGIILSFSDKLPFALGKLPGDIVYKKENASPDSLFYQIVPGNSYSLHGKPGKDIMFRHFRQLIPLIFIIKPAPVLRLSFNILSARQVFIRAH